MINTNNDQKIISTNNRINWKIKQQHKTFVKECSILCQRSFVSEIVFVCCLQVCLAWKTIFCQTDKGNRVKHRQILAGCLWGGWSNLLVYHSESKWLHRLDTRKEVTSPHNNKLFENKKKKILNKWHMLWLDWHMLLLHRHEKRSEKSQNFLG